MTITPAIISRLLADQKNKCSACWRTIPDFHVHHAIYTRDKRMKELDCVENLILLCPSCHLDNHGRLTSWFRRCVFWSAKIDGGYEMEKWNNDLDMKVKDNFIYLGEETNGKR